MRLRDCAPKGVRGQFLDALLNTADAVKTKLSLGLLFTRDLVNASEPAVGTKYDPKSRSKPSRYSSENDVLIEKSVKYTDFFLLSIVYV